MSAAKFFRENLNPPRPLTQQERDSNTLKGMLALAEQLDRIEQQQRTIKAELDQVQQIVRGLR